MKVWLFIALLAQQSTATPADSATARALLRAGIDALEAAPTLRYDVLLPRRWLDQLELWSLPDEVARATAMLDRADEPGRRRPSYPALTQAAQAVLAVGDTSRALLVFSRVPEVHREDMMARTAVSLMGQRQPSPWSSWVESRLTSGWPRAQVLDARHRRALAAGDTLAAHEWLAQAIVLTAGDSLALPYTWSWRARLVGLGKNRDPQDVLRSALHGIEPRMHRAVLHDVASILVTQNRRDAALAVLDSLERIDAGLPGQGRELRLAQHLLLRGTAADSVAGRRLRDSIYAAASARTPPALTSGPMLLVARQLRHQVLQQQVFGHRVTADTLAFLFTRLEREARAPRDLERREARRDSLARFIPLALEASLSYLAGAEVSALDSLRSLGAAAMSHFDPDRAERMMVGISTPRLRDRAQAALLLRRAASDVDGVALAAGSLADASARSAVFTELAERAAISGRLSTAVRLAGNSSVPEDLVRARLAIARAFASAGRTESARQHIVSALDALSPNWQCQWPQCTTGNPQAMEPERIADVIRLAIDLGLLDRLREWADRQPGDGSAGAAYLAIVEEMSRRFLGRSPNYLRPPV